MIIKQVKTSLDKSFPFTAVIVRYSCGR